MFFGYGMTMDSDSISVTGDNSLVNGVKVSQGIFDHLTFEDDANTLVTNTTQPSTWDSTTLLNVTFDNTINGGSISQFIGFIDSFSIQRRELNSNSWVTLQTITKDTNGLLATNFTMYDNFAKNDTVYVYRVVPANTNGIGTSIEQEVLSKFNKAVIADTRGVYNVTMEYKINSSQRNQQVATYVPYGSKYPIVVYNAVTNYESGSINAVLLAPTSKTSAYLDRKAQTQLSNQFTNWLLNTLPKVVKDFNGKFVIANITGAVANSYYKELGNGLASASFSYVEVGDDTQETYDKLGITNNFEIIINE